MASLMHTGLINERADRRCGSRVVRVATGRDQTPIGLKLLRRLLLRLCQASKCHGEWRSASQRSGLAEVTARAPRRPIRHLLEHAGA